MALSGHTSPQVLIRHYLDTFIAPCPSAREMFGRLSSSRFSLWQSSSQFYLAATSDSCVVWYDEISKRRNTAGQSCTADTYRPRRHVPLSPRSSCNRGSPGVIQARRYLTSGSPPAPATFRLFAHVLFAVHHPTPFRLHAPLRTKSPYCEFPRSIRYILGLVRYCPKQV
jgi:hypothetical protein